MAGRRWLLTAFALLGFAAPVAAQAQAAAPSQEAVAALAKLHVELNAARDEFNTKIAAIHEAEAKTEAREEFSNHVAEIFAKHGRTQEEYQKLLFGVSTDSAQRELFDKLVKEAQEAGSA